MSPFKGLYLEYTVCHVTGNIRPVDRKMFVFENVMLKNVHTNEMELV